MADKSIVKMVLKDVSKVFYSKTESFEILRGISIEVMNNEFLIIFGPGQCGKTVLLNIIAGLQAPTRGEIYFDGKLQEGISDSVGLIFQKSALMPWKTVLENVEMGPKFKGVPRRQRREKAMHYIELVGLSGFENSYPHQLSGGMKQRVGIARAYCNDSAILLMDEPFGQLDAQTRYQMEEEVLRVWEMEKRTVIFVTNNIEEAVYLGDRIVLLSSPPSQVKNIYPNELSRPRDYMDYRFLARREEIAQNTDLVV